MKMIVTENLDHKKFTVENFIERLQKLPKDWEIKSYKFITDDGNCRYTFETGKNTKR